MSKTKIEWCDYTINPVKGLCPMGCPYCYARRMHKRFKWNTEIRFIPDWMDGLPGADKPSRIFVGSTMELFGDWVKPVWQSDILQTASAYPWHTFIFLTKQPQNLVKFSPFPPNCWVGVSATNSKMAWNGYAGLHAINAQVKFLSIEPLLEEIDTRMFDRELSGTINWVIIGQQTPVRKSTMPRLEWVKDIVDAADQAGIPVFLKDNLKPLIQESGRLKAEWAATEWVQCKYPILRQELPEVKER